MRSAAGSGVKRFPVAAMLLWAMPGAFAGVPASAQEADEHEAHHVAGAGVAPAPAPASATTGSPTTTATARSSSGAAGATDTMMPGMGEGEQEHVASREPFFTRLLAFASLDARERARLGGDARDRVDRGLQVIGAASADGIHAHTPGEQLRLARRLAEGTALLESGAAARSALDGGDAPSKLAESWFRDQMSLASPDADAPAAWQGFSWSHIVLMVFLGLVSVSLFALQMLRWQRVKALVTAGRIPPVAQPVKIAPERRAIPLSRDAKTIAGGEGGSAGGAALRKPRSWSGQLRVVQIHRETPTILTFRLADPSAGRLPFDFLPGQFLQVEVESEPGQSARRSYTIATSPTQRAYVEITVRREQQGAVSRILHDQVKAGDMIKVRAPFGVFTFTGTDSDSIVLIAGGVGITPMMSVLRYLTDTAWPGEIYFLYGARSTEEFVFREEIEWLERRFANLHVVGAMQRTPGTVWLGAEGPITREMLAAAVPEIARRRIHLCGPPPMMAAVRRQLADLGVPDAQLITEAFGPASLPIDPIEDAGDGVGVAKLAAPGVGAKPPEDVAAATVTFAISGVSAALREDETVLEAAEGAGVEIPYSCRAGTCGVCVTKLLDGQVTMAVESGLAADDKAAGYILACQAKSTGVPLVVEA